MPPLNRSETVTSESVYCDIQMTIEEAVEMLEVLRALREAGGYPALEDKFRDMQTQLTDSISYAASDRIGLLQSKPKH